MWVEANGLRIFYEEFGSGPPLVLLHGGTNTGRGEWERCIPLFAARFRTIVPDSRGHGRTANPSDHLRYRQMADDVAAFTAALGLDRPVICGWSDGGQIALEIGIEHPESASLLIAGGVLFRHSGQYLAEARRFLHADQHARVDHERLERESPETVEWLRRHEQSGGSWKRHISAVAGLWLKPFNLTPERFARIQTPTLLVLGDRDAAIPLVEVTDMLTLIPDAELAVIPGADHSIPFSRAETFASIVDDFVDRRSGRE